MVSLSPISNSTSYCDVQSAYRHGHSIKTAVLKVYLDIIDAISNGKFAFLLLLDLTAAFDTVDHEILLHHLETKFGFCDAILQWLGSYLEERTQFIMLNGQSTVDWTVICGMPQGSVFESLLFTFYTVDIGKLIHQYGLSRHSYADVNQLYSSCIPSESVALKAKMIWCIISIGGWMAINRLMLNPSKSEFMQCASHVASRSSPDLHSPFRMAQSASQQWCEISEHILMNACLWRNTSTIWFVCASTNCGASDLSVLFVDCGGDESRELVHHSQSQLL